MKPRTAKSMGYSVRNLKYMAKFDETYPDCEFVQQVVAQISWGHNIVLMDKIANPEERKWYIEQAFVGNQYHLNVGGDDFYITK